MKTHEFAKALRTLADVFDRGPNRDLSSLAISSDAPSGITMTQMAVSLSTLTDLARVDKQRWIAFVRDNNMPIEFRARDAARDILGKVLAYLETNADARRALKEKATKRADNTSPELMRAFAFLLKDQNSE